MQSAYFRVLETNSESYPRLSYFTRRLKYIAPRMKRIVGMMNLLIPTILLWPSMTSALLDPCPDGYYYLRMTEECLPCEKLCNQGYNVECARRCQGFTTTTMMTPTTETNKADKTPGMIVMYILIGLIVLALIGCIAYMKCKPQERRLQEYLLCTQNKPPNANDTAVTVQATQDENEPNLLDPTAPGVSHRPLVPDKNITRPAD